MVNDHSGISDINPDFCINFYIDNILSFSGYGIESVTFLSDCLTYGNSKLNYLN